MTSLKQILEHRAVDIKALQGDLFTFSGSLSEPIITGTQSLHLQRNHIQVADLNDMLVEFGWGKGVEINLVKHTSNTRDKVARVEWRLERPNTELNYSRTALLKPFGALMFAITADILLETQ